MAAPLKTAKATESEGNELTLDQIIVKVTNMVSYDSKAQQMARQRGLNINYVSWEDCARSMGSCWGPCISDMTLQVNNSCMPVMREPNYTDKTWDVAITKIPIVIGNQTANPDEQLQTISLKDYLLHFSDFMSNDVYRTRNKKKINLLRDNDKDSHVIMSSQACFLPIQQGKETKFNVALYNYQSRPRNPALLVIVSTSKGSSAQIIEGTTQYLVFNNNGKMADFVGERVSDVRMKKEGADTQDVEAIFDKELSKEEKKDNVIVIVQVPLVQKPIARRRKHHAKKGKSMKEKKMKKKRSRARKASLSDDEDANVEAAIVKVADRSVKCKCGKDMEQVEMKECYNGSTIECDECGKSIQEATQMVYHCMDTKNKTHADGYDLCVECGDKQLRFDELRGMTENEFEPEYVLKRNQEFPVRVTLQYYKATDNGAVTNEIMDDIANQLKASQKQADFIGSLVTEYNPNRPTNWIQQKMDEKEQEALDVAVKDGYKLVASALQEHCGDDWKEYLANFEKEQVTDTDVKDLSADDLKALIPKIGPRNRFDAWRQANMTK